jgi:sodium/hydrogen antiporter
MNRGAASTDLVCSNLPVVFSKYVCRVLLLQDDLAGSLDGACGRGTAGTKPALPHRQMVFPTWYFVVGIILVAMAVASTLIRRLPLTTAMLYLAIGAILGPVGFGLIRVDAIGQSAVLERVTEVVVIISLFTAGLKLRTSLADPIWWLPLRLSIFSMIITVGLVALAGVILLGLPLGAAVLLGAILAPTDPVLASDVQVENPTDRDRLRFSLTGEAGLNDGTAFPFVMLGLGLLNLHDIGASGWRWLAVDVVWAIAGGLAVGGLLGTLVGQAILYLRRTYRKAVGVDDFLGLGLIALSYGAALLIHTYGFLAVFAAGLALRRVEVHNGQDTPPEELLAAATLKGKTEEIATAPATAPAYMAQAVLGFNEQLERIAEVAAVILLGGLLVAPYLDTDVVWFAPLLFLVFRPLAVGIGLIGVSSTRPQLSLISWFGVRGVGSIYYLMFALQHGLAPDLAQPLTALTLTVVAVSVVVHGISVTPLMTWYSHWRSRRFPAPLPSR